MKKFVCVSLAAIMLFSVTACSAAQTGSSSENTEKQSITFTAGTYTGKANGHNGPVSVDVTLSDNKIETIKVLESNETKGIGDVAADHIINDIVTYQSLAVDNVAGCTISANAYLSAVKDALSQSGADLTALTNIKVEKSAEQAKTYDTDVVVVGAGCAGLSAAIEAASTGAKVIVLEKLPRTGGATRTSSGMVVAGGTELQKATGVEDTVQNLKDYWKERGEGQIDEEMTDYVADHMNEALDWMMDMGVDYKNGAILYSGTATVNRAHMPAGAGVNMIDCMVEKAESLGVEIILEAPVESLMQNENGEVIGVVATHNGAELKVNAKSVILATGGYGWNADLIEKYSPNAAGAWPVTAPGNTGDGLLMAMDAGADTVFKGGYIGWKVVNPAYGHTSPVGAPIYGAANLIVNKDGNRFGDESMDYPFVYENMAKDDRNEFYFIFDSEKAESVDLEKNVSSTLENLKKGVEAGVCYSADTLEELAEKVGLEHLPETVAQFNAAIDTGKDDAFNRNTATMKKLENGPFYALRAQRATLGTFGGINTNITGEVVDANEDAIPGLYAAGEVANGEFFPVIYPASGSSLSMCVVLGREAGRSAAAYAVK